MIENEYSTEGRLTDIIITGNKYPATVHVDTDMIAKLKKHLWSVNKRGYVICTRCSKLLHRFTVDAKEGEIVDHINRNPKNNRKYNLRIVSIQQNSMNRTANSKALIPIKGVYLKNDKWRVEIARNGVKRYLGTYDDLNEAVIRRIRAEYEIFGEFSLDYSDILKHIPAELRLIYLPEIYGGDNYKCKHTKVYQAFMVHKQKDINGADAKLKRYRKDTRKEYKLDKKSNTLYNKNSLK